MIGDVIHDNNWGTYRILDYDCEEMLYYCLNLNTFACVWFTAEEINKRFNVRKDGSGY